MPQKVGIRLTREISLKVGWANFTEKLVKSVTEGFKAFNGDYMSGVNAVLALVGAAKSVKVDTPPGARGVELILLCFAWSFDALRASKHLKEKAAKAAARKAIKALKQRVEAGELEIPHDFFEQPAAAEPYRLLRDEFLRSWRAFRPPGRKDEASLKARFDSAFCSAIFEIWAARASVFAELAHALESPAAKTADFERQWRAYRKSLIHEFEVAPLFGQEETCVSLGQLYVPLRCFWREVEQSGDPSVRYDEDLTTKTQIHHVRSLHDELDAWLDDDDPDDWLRLLGGGPGSGKSTSARAFVARIAEREDLRPIYIPLQRLTGEGRLRDSINSHFRDRSGCAFQDGPIERKHVENGPPLLLVFDGLDEIARPGESADEIAREMIDWITDLHGALRGETGVQHRALVTGRMPSFQAARRRANRTGKEALEVVDFLPVDVNRGAVDPQPGNIEVEGNQALLEADYRDAWWTGYSRALGRPAKRPAGLTNRRLASLTAEPLLCYLLALSGYLEEKSEEAAENRNNVYERLLLDVWKRGWGGGRAGTGKTLSKKNFDRLFETMALAAWHGGDERVATLENFEKALKVTQATEIYAEFKQHEGGDVSNLAVNFYLKRAEEEARGFEFTHKSFGEYLTARALTRAAIDVAELSTRRMDVALSDWLAAVADGNPSGELLEFLRDEARLLPLDKAASMLRTLEQMMSDVIANGFPAHDLRCETWRQAEERQRKAETLLMTVLHCSSMRVAVDDKAQARIRIDWRGDGLAFGNLLHRIRKSSVTVLPALTLFHYVEAPNSFLYSQDLFGSNFLAANLQNSNCYGAVFQSAILMKANLADAILADAILGSANLKGANLEGANLEGANLEGANLEGANLKGANLGPPNIEGTSLMGANLKGANLKGANLESANLESANLEGANLESANLEGANLEGANLDGEQSGVKKTRQKTR